MLPNQPPPPPPPAPGSASLKRPYGQQAHAYKNPMPPLKQESSTPSLDSRPDNRNQRPKKAPKMDGVQSTAGPSSSYRSGHAATRRAPEGSKFTRGSPLAGRGGHKAGSKRQPPIPAHPLLPEPFHNLEYLKDTYRKKPLKQEWETNPKSPLSNYYLAVNGGQVTYNCVQYRSGPGPNLVWRATITLKSDEEGGSDVVAIGDHSTRKDAEKLAALSALYQLDATGQFDPSKKAKGPQTQQAFAPAQVELSDGTSLQFERALQFMDYYCRRFNFPKPEVKYQNIPNRQYKNVTWEAVMSVDGKNIGVGSGASKKASMTSCYVDVVHYLESCDPTLWQEFVRDAKSGRDLGLAKPILLMVDDNVADQVHDLCRDIRDSQLYYNRPRFRSQSGGHDDDQEPPTEDAPKYVAPFRRNATEAFFTAKSERLSAWRKQYLEDPKMENMRKSRSALPVYTKAAELIAHIRENEVTICMAATGSGKTTQIPQIILDDCIDRGEGAKCNIVCTQPRRIAAISVANRVSAERGQTAGNSVGYQVRFEKKLPEDHGSITFCTTGIFLKRMHSALQEGASSHNGMDDVTHIIVDEAHERDVDTDLLLVVLKRLIADRKARNKPLKVVLMSATIDPKLFQEYFPDDHGRPAQVIEVPGRAYPVQKHFLDDYLPALLQTTGQGARWVFQDQLVQKYLAQELGSALNSIPGMPPLRYPPSQNSNEDLETPHPLIALAITHALLNSTDGHVLVFLSGWDDIISVQKCLLDTGRSLGIDYNAGNYSIHLLHSTIPIAEQEAIFSPPPEGQRRIILATNIAETSVTIPDVVYVVDSAKVKEQRYDPELRISALVTAWVGSSNLNQRAGRAGRHRSGEYYGLLSRQRADRLHPHQTVEMKRVDLSDIVMHVKALDFPGMTVEEVLAATIEPPAAERVEAAMKALLMVGALDKDQQLTPLGRVLLQLPVDTQIGKLVLFGSFFRCLDQALSLAAIFTNRDPFVSPVHLREEANARKHSFCPEEYRSDALTILKAYNAWWAMQSRGDYVTANRFCVDNFLSKPTLLLIQKIKAHILKSLYDVGVIDVSAGGTITSYGRTPRYRGGELVVPPALDANGDSLPLLSALITIALQPKFAIRIGDKTYRTSQDKVVFVHPSSVNARRRGAADTESDLLIEKQIIAFAEKRQNLSAGDSNPQKFLVNTTRIDPLAYILFGAYRVEVNRRGLECDEWLPIIGSFTALDDLERLKVLMEMCMLRVFQGVIKQGSKQHPSRPDGKEDESDDEDGDRTEAPLSSTEIKELDSITQDVVHILNDHSAHRIASQSRHNSRPGTPMGSPSWTSRRLGPSGGGGTRSGYSTPRAGGIAFLSRPSTPSRLSRK